MTSQTLSSIYNFTTTVTAYNPNTRVVTLANPVNISVGYNQLFGSVQSEYTINGLQTSIAAAINAGSGVPNLSTDEAGNFVGIFNVPPNTFQTGQRVFRLDNRTVANDPTTATTYAQAVFTAYSLVDKAQQTDFSPSVDSSTTTFTPSAQATSQNISVIQTYQPSDPIAQTFIVSPDNYPNGIFITSVKLFFAAKTSSNIPVTVSIVGTLNGYPNGQILDNSTVSLNPSQVLVSQTPQYLDPTTYTEFVFPAPVYIQSGVLYAIMINSSSPDYQVYYAQQNQTAIASSSKALPTDATPSSPSKIGNAPYVGALFESQNSITWTADQTKDLMFVIDRAVFNTSVTPSIPFVVPANLPYRKLGIEDVLYKVSANSVTNLYGNFSRNLYMDALNVATTDYIPSDTSISYSYATTLLSTRAQTATSPITPGKYGTPTPDNVALNDGQGRRVLMKSSNSSFVLYATLSSSDPNVSPVISDDGLSLYDIRYVINNMGIGNNCITILSQGTGYNALTTTATVSAPDVGSNTATVTVTANNGSITHINVVNPGAGYLGLKVPTITISDSNTSPGSGANVVVSVETAPSGGNGMAKYFTKKVVMTPGNDSGDMRVYYTAYKPVGTECYVYYKILSSQDTVPFDTVGWQLMTQTQGVNTYSTDPSNLIEYEWAPGINNTANNTISYTNSNGQTFSSFIQFAIKIVMATSDTTNVPFLTDVRALALPPGTGI